MSTAHVLEPPGDLTAPTDGLDSGTLLPQILDAIKQMSLTERLAVAEMVLQSLREEMRPLERREQKRKGMEAAAQLLREDYESGAVGSPPTWEERCQQMAEAAKIALPYYQTDPELTIFTALDGEDFYDYEAK